MRCVLAVLSRVIFTAGWIVGSPGQTCTSLCDQELQLCKENFWPKSALKLKQISAKGVDDCGVVLETWQTGNPSFNPSEGSQRNRTCGLNAGGAHRCDDVPLPGWVRFCPCFGKVKDYIGDSPTAPSFTLSPSTSPISPTSPTSPFVPPSLTLSPTFFPSLSPSPYLPPSPLAPSIAPSSSSTSQPSPRYVPPASAGNSDFAIVTVCVIAVVAIIIAAAVWFVNYKRKAVQDSFFLPDEELQDLPALNLNRWTVPSQPPSPPATARFQRLG